MFWSPSKRAMPATIGTLAFLGLAGAASAGTLVVRSSGPSAKNYPPGRAIPDGRKIALAANDQVTIIDARGTRTFKGPGSFDPAAASAGAAGGTGTTLAALVGQPTERRARIGAVRSVGGAAPRSPNIWYVEADRSGAHCVADPANVMLWRPNMTTAQTYTITGGGRTGTVVWLKGQSAQKWPATLPVAGNVDYRIAPAGQAAPATVRFVMLGKDEPLDTLASHLIGNKCTAQLDLLVDAAAAPDANAPTG